MIKNIQNPALSVKLKRQVFAQHITLNGREEPRNAMACIRAVYFPIQCITTRAPCILTIREVDAKPERLHYPGLNSGE